MEGEPLNQQSQDIVDDIVREHQDGFARQASLRQSAERAEHQANRLVTEAEDELQRARAHLEQAQQRAADAQKSVSKAKGVVELIAEDVAVAIATNQDLDPWTQTIVALTYADNYPDAEAYPAAAARGRIALLSLRERMQPGQPILWLPDRSTIVVGKAAEETLVVTPPRVKDEVRPLPDTRLSALKGGAIDLVMSQATVARVVNDRQAHGEEELGGLVQTESETQQFSLIRDPHGYQNCDIERLEAMVSNEERLVVGEAAILAKLDQLTAPKRFIALTALAAADIQLPVEVDEAIKQTVEASLLDLVAFLAAGGGQELTTKTVSAVRGTRTVTVPTTLSRMSQEINVQSIRAMFQTIGLDQQTLKQKVQTMLEGRREQGTTSVGQVAQDIRSGRDLERMLDTIFQDS